MSKSVKEVLGLQETLDQTVKSVKQNLKNDVRSKFKIGQELFSAKKRAKEENDERSYDVMFDRLPFGKSTGDKFIRIIETDYLVEIAKGNNASNLPSGYNVLYAFTHKDVVDNSYVLTRVNLSIKNGLFVWPGAKTLVKSSEIGVDKFKDYIKSVIDDRSNSSGDEPLEGDDWPKNINPTTGEPWTSSNDDVEDEPAEGEENGSLEGHMTIDPTEFKVGTVMIRESSFNTDYFKVLELKRKIDDLISEMNRDEKGRVKIAFTKTFDDLKASTKMALMDRKFEEEMELHAAA